MKKMTELANFLPELAFIAFIIKSVIYGTGIGDALAIISFVISMGYKHYLSKTKVDDVEDINRKIDAISAKIQSLSIDRSIKRSANEQKVETGPRRLF